MVRAWQCLAHCRRSRNMYWLPESVGELMLNYTANLFLCPIGGVEAAFRVLIPLQMVRTILVQYKWTLESNPHTNLSSAMS